MLDGRRMAYLDAMGIGVWTLREGDAGDGQQNAETRCEPPALKLGPGGGGVLLVCDRDSDSASHLANDIGRALGNQPVWSWPCAGETAPGLEEAVEEHLFTTVAIFGESLAQRFFSGGMPANLGSARLVLLPDMQDLLTTPERRRDLWKTICRHGMASPDARNS